MLLTIFVVFISFVILIIIHELGHFILAKKFGIEVEEFGIGFPPRLLGKKIGETIYSINLLPLGGFVKIRGEDGGPEDSRSFSGKPIWQRYLVILGGVIAFWIIAAVILSVVAGGWGFPIAIADEAGLNNDLINPRVVVSGVASGTLAEEVGLKQGDIIAGFEKRKELYEFLKDNKGKEVAFNINRGNDVLEKKMRANLVLQIDNITKDTPAEAIGLKERDILLGFYTVKEFQEFVKDNQYQEIVLNIKRGDEVLEKSVTIEESLGVRIGERWEGARFSGVATKTYPWHLAPLGGIETTGHYTVQIVYGWVIIGGWALGVSDLPEGIEEEDVAVMGPIGIFSMMSDFFETGIDSFLMLVALVAVALALVNILPIPALDGGRMAFLIIEAIRGKPMNYKIEQKINTIFFVLLICLMIFITIRFDIPGILNN